MNQKKTPRKKRAAKPKARILAQVELTPAVEEILKSNEAKLYLGGIERANGKLQALIRRELAVQRHPGHAGTA